MQLLNKNKNLLCIHNSYDNQIINNYYKKKIKTKIQNSNKIIKIQTT